VRSPEVCAFAGCTFRQLDYWCRTGRVPGVDMWDRPGSGGRREFTRAQAEHVRLLAALLRAGLTIDIATTIAADASSGQRVHTLPGHVLVELPASLMPSQTVSA